MGRVVFFPGKFVDSNRVAGRTPCGRNARLSVFDHAVVPLGSSCRARPPPPPHPRSPPTRLFVCFAFFHARVHVGRWTDGALGDRPGAAAAAPAAAAAATRRGERVRAAVPFPVYVDEQFAEKTKQEVGDWLLLLFAVGWLVVRDSPVVDSPVFSRSVAPTPVARARAMYRRARASLLACTPVC